MPGVDDIKAALEPLYAEIDRLKTIISKNDQSAVDEIVSSINTKRDSIKDVAASMSVESGVKK